MPTDKTEKKCWKNSVKRFHCAFVLCCFNTPQIISPNSCVCILRSFSRLRHAQLYFSCYLGFFSKSFSLCFVGRLAFHRPPSSSRAGLDLIIFNFKISLLVSFSMRHLSSVLTKQTPKQINKQTSRKRTVNWMSSHDVCKNENAFERVRWSEVENIRFSCAKQRDC